MKDLILSTPSTKNHQGGLKGRNQKPKVVKQFANLENPETEMFCEII